MTGADSSGDDGSEPESASSATRLARRRYLSGLVAAGASGALAGCGDTIESLFEAAGEVPSVSLSDQRLVQTVEDTRVDGASGSPTTLDDPRLVEGYRVAPVFGLSGQNLDNLDDLDIEVDVSGGPTTTFTLPASAVQDIDAGADPAAVFTDAASGSNTPTVTLEAGTSQVTVEAVEPESGLTLDSVTFSEGTDFTSVAPDAIRVGFVGVQDPDNGSNFGSGNNGQLANFSRSARMAHRYLVSTFPGGVMSFSYNAGTITSDPDDNNADYSAAYTTLQKAAKGQHNTRPNFPNGGTFRNDTHLTDADARSAIQNNGFDVTVLILPDGYYGGLGLYPGSRKMAVSTLEPEANRGGWDEAEFTHTVAQEIAHNLRGDPYTDPSLHPLAQRGSGGSDATANGSPVDRDHARHQNSQGGGDPPGVTSVGYDFTDGQFRTIDSTEYDAAGNFSIGGQFGSGSNRSVVRLESYMSYSYDDVWTDSRMHEELIDSNFQRSSWGSPSSAVLSGRGDVTETGGVAYDNVVTYRGPAYLADVMSETGRESTQGVQPGDIETGIEDGQGQTEEPGRETTGEPELTDDEVELVTVELRGPNPDEEPLVTAEVPDRISPYHTDEVFTVPQFVVEFPRRTVSVQSQRADEVSSFNPITRVVGDAVDRIPDRGFAGEPDATRDRIQRSLETVDTFMSDRLYGEALATMDTNVRADITEGIRAEYESAGSNQPFRADVIELVDRMVARLETLAPVR